VVTIEPGGLCIGPAGVRLSFQRFQSPADGIVTGTPTSLGALPLARDHAGRLLLPVADDEAFWIGLSHTQPAGRAELALAVLRADGRELDALSGTTWAASRPEVISVPESRCISGIRRRDGRSAVFARSAVSAEGPGCAALTFYITAAAPAPKTARGKDHAGTVIELVDYDAFRTRTGVEPPGPLDPAAGYQGWRLP
jgi:hypothetical protein